MKKLVILFIIFFSQTISVNAENSDKIKRIVVGNKNAKITIITYESLTCSHCANFHIDVYPKLKRDYIDTGIAKIEFRHFPLDIAAFNASKVSQCKNDGSSKILDSLRAISFAIGVLVTHLIKTFNFFSLNSSRVLTSFAPSFTIFSIGFLFLLAITNRLLPFSKIFLAIP